MSAGTSCRPATDLCDAIEDCTGVATAPCPTDSASSAFTVCRPAADVCDVSENCDGTNVACPADSVQPATFTCRASAGVCDVAEQCDGTAVTCPADGFLPNTTSCRGAAGVCDADEFCTGGAAACPGDAKLTSVCRAAVDVCDAVESCDGVADTCPSNALEPATTVCRAAGAACDTPELCTGSSSACPAEVTTDSDGDSVGDGCDPCNNIVPVYATKPKLKVKAITSPPGNDSFQFHGDIVVPATPTINPVVKGARVVITTSLGTTVVDATIPPGAYVNAQGAGWQANAAGTSFTYRNRNLGVPVVSGVQKFKIKLRPAVPGKLSFTVRGKRSTYSLPVGELPLKGTIVIDAPQATTGQCGEATFQGAPPNPGNCTANGSNTVVKCK